MKQFAQIRDGKVINMFEWNEEKPPKIKGLRHIDITEKIDRDSIKVGWTFENDKFAEPEKLPVDLEKQKEKAKFEIFDRFLEEEKSFLEITEEVKAKYKIDKEKIHEKKNN